MNTKSIFCFLKCEHSYMSLNYVLKKLCVVTCGVKAMVLEWMMKDGVFAVIFTADPWGSVGPRMTWRPTVRLYCTGWREQDPSVLSAPNIWPHTTQKEKAISWFLLVYVYACFYSLSPINTQWYSCRSENVPLFTSTVCNFSLQISQLTQISLSGVPAPTRNLSCFILLYCLFSYSVLSSDKITSVCALRELTLYSRHIHATYCFSNQLPALTTGSWLMPPSEAPLPPLSPLPAALQPFDFAFSFYLKCR